MDDFPELAVKWLSVAPRLGDLQPLPDRERGLIRALRAFLRTLPKDEDEFVTVVIPETLSSTRLSQFLRNGSLFWLKAALLFEGGVVICDVPLLPEERTAAALHADRPVERERNVVLLPVSAVNDATVRAVVYAKSLHPRSLEALFFASDPEEVPQIIEAWSAAEIDIPLAIVDAPFRDIGPPLLEEIRRYTARGDAVVTVVLPELVVRRWWEHFLHGQTGLYIKRLLLFEPDVVVTSVPYRV
jgi:hypothetical protein